MLENLTFVTLLQALHTLPWSSTGLSRTIGSNPWSVLLILFGVTGLAAGILGLVQTRSWPRHPSQSTAAAQALVDEAADPPTQTAPAPSRSPPPAPRAPRNPQAIEIRLPQIDERHPDVWSHTEELHVEVRVAGEALGVDKQATCTLRVERATPTPGQSQPLTGTQARFTITPPGKGETRLRVRVHRDDQTLAENHLGIRFVDYRNEIVETFEDFEKWALTQYPLPKRSLTAREFVDFFADIVPGTPTQPLDEIVDVYELANFSDHDVNRTTYLQMVEAFLVLEDAGALEGPQAAQAEAT